MSNIQDVWQLLIDEYTEFPHRKCANATDEQIKEIEKIIGMKFHDQYKYFLKNHQASSIGALDMYTINRAEDSSTGRWSLELADQHYKKGEHVWPDIEDWYIVSDCDGDPIGISPKGEVWTSYHDSGFEQEKLANNFEEFAYKLLTETLWE